jgi:hypothetical protein
MPIPTWKQYEYQVVDAHTHTYGHITWHNDIIPEDELYKAGFIHSYNKHRLERIARKRAEKGKSITVLYNKMRHPFFFHLSHIFFYVYFENVLLRFKDSCGEYIHKV